MAQLVVNNNYNDDDNDKTTELSTMNDCPIFKIFQNGFDGGMLSFIVNYLQVDDTKLINDITMQNIKPRPIQEPRPTHNQRFNIVANSSHRPNMWSEQLNDVSTCIDLIKELYIKNVSFDICNSSYRSNQEYNNLEKQKVDFDFVFDGEWEGETWKYDLTYYLAKVESREHDVLGKAPAHKYWCHGYVVWTLVETPEKKYEARIGEKAIEMLCGFVHHTSVNDMRMPIMIDRNHNNKNITCCYTHFELMGYTTYPSIDQPIIGPDWYRFKIMSKPIMEKIFDNSHTRCYNYNNFVGRSACNNGKFDAKLIIKLVKIPDYLYWKVPDAHILLQPIINARNIDQLRKEIVQLHVNLINNNGCVYLSISEVTKVLREKKKAMEGWDKIKPYPSDVNTNIISTTINNNNNNSCMDDVNDNNNNVKNEDEDSTTCNTATLVGRLLKSIRYFIKKQKDEMENGNNIILDEMKLCHICKNEIIYCKNECISVRIDNLK